MADTHRDFKNRLYGQFARIGKALGSPHRIEMLELLAQGERTVDSLASEIGLSVANASQHLQALRQAALVESRKDGLFVHYRLAAPGILSYQKRFAPSPRIDWRISNAWSVSTSPIATTRRRFRLASC